MEGEGYCLATFGVNNTKIYMSEGFLVLVGPLDAGSCPTIIGTALTVHPSYFSCHAYMQDTVFRRTPVEFFFARIV